MTTQLTKKPADNKPAVKEIFVCGDKQLTWIENDFFRGTASVPNVKIIHCQPSQVWIGGRISAQLWEQIINFMRWSQETYKAEALITLFYNRAEKRWEAWPFMQHPAGMTISYDRADPTFAEDRAKFGRDWIEMGTVHHHCTSSAFQSGTDKDDETDRDGLHVTFGNMDKPVLDIHVRQVFESQQLQLTQPAHLYPWIDIPEWVSHIPESFNDVRRDVFGQWLKTGNKDTGFPEAWKDRVTPFRRETKSPLPGKVIGRFTAASGTKREGMENAPWFQEKKAKCREVATVLNLTMADAYMLLACIRLDQLHEDDRALRQQIIRELNAREVTWLVAEDLFRSLAADEMSESKNEEQPNKELSETSHPG